MVLHNRDSEQYGELTIGKSLCEVSLVRFSDSCIGKTTHGTEYTATVNAVADRQHSAVLEGVPKPGKVIVIKEPTATDDRNIRRSAYSSRVTRSRYSRPPRRDQGTVAFFLAARLGDYRNLSCDGCKSRSNRRDRPRCCNTCVSHLATMFRVPLVQTRCGISKIG